MKKDGSRFHDCVRSAVLLAAWRDALKKQAEERALDAEEAAKKIIFFEAKAGV